TLRPKLLAAVATKAQDPTLVAEAKRLAATYMRSPQTLDPQLAITALGAATHGGDVALTRQLDAAFAATEDHHLRTAILAGMALATEPNVRAKAFARLADHSLTLEELVTVLTVAAIDPTSRDEVYAFATAHLDDVIASLPSMVRPAIVLLAGFFCD